MGDIIEFSKGKRKHKKAADKQVSSKQKSKKTSIAVKLISLTLFFIFIICQGVISMGTSHVGAIIIFITFWISIFALSAHYSIISHYNIPTGSKENS